MKVQDIITRLENIAKENSDAFTYVIHIKPSNPIEYVFVAEEMSERHHFISGRGNTIEDALDDANKRISDRCKGWNYRE